MLTHVAGTFLIHADGAFLNGAGLGEGDDRNRVVPKTYFVGRERIPYISAQAWRRWLRDTLIEETGWEPSELRAIEVNTKGATNKIAGELNPVDFAEDDCFGYMKAEKSSGNRKKKGEEGAGEEDVLSTKALTRTSPFVSSILTSIRRHKTLSTDEGFVHLKEGTPLPYSTQFYCTELQGVFCLDYMRLGVFSNTGDRIELDEALVKKYLAVGKISIKKDKGEKGKIYELADMGETRRLRARELLKALAVLRGGAKQAAFGTDVAPKVLIMAGLTCGNPIFNHLFSVSGGGPELKIDTFKEVVKDYASRIVTPVFLGIRRDFLFNDSDVRELDGVDIDGVKLQVVTPVEAVRRVGELLP